MEQEPSRSAWGLCLCSIGSLKWGLIVGIVGLNILLSWLVLRFDRYPWYLIFLSVGTLYKVLMIALVCCSYIVWRLRLYLRSALKSCAHAQAPEGGDENPDSESPNPVHSFWTVFVVPCYTEGKEAVHLTLNSLLAGLVHLRSQHPGVRPLVFVVVDGMATGHGNDQPTYEYVMDVLAPQAPRADLGTSAPLPISYPVWKQAAGEEPEGLASVEMVLWESTPVCVVRKFRNQGKKDSLILFRDIAMSLASTSERLPYLDQFVGQMYGHNLPLPAAGERVRYMVGTDMGSFFAEEAFSDLVGAMEDDPDALGASGFIRVAGRPCVHFWVEYQYFEYVLQQGLTRYAQGLLGKVTCLPGCLQIIRCEDPSKLAEPMRRFRQCPAPLNHAATSAKAVVENIRAHLGEDRRFTGLVLYANPLGRMIVVPGATVYTDVPDTFAVFLSQRRRWFLSSQANNFRDLAEPSLPWLIRLVAFAQLWNFVFAPLCMVCLGRLLYGVGVTAASGGGRDWAVFAAFSTVIFIAVYKLGLAVVLTDRPSNIPRLIFSLLLYAVVCPFINTILGMYALATLDDHRWGATQRVVAAPTTFPEADMVSGDADDDHIVTVYI